MKKRWAEYRRKKVDAAKIAGKPAVRKKVAPKKVAVKAATQPSAEGVSE